MRALLFAGDDRHFDMAESGGFEPLMQLHLAEAQPVIGVELARLFKTMTEQIQHDDAAPFFQDTVRRCNR